MQILYDGYIYSVQAAGGINRYFANIISKLPQDIEPVLTTCQPRNINHPTHPNLKTIFYQRFGFRPGRLSYWLEQHYFRAIETFRKFDLVHPTYYSLLTRRDLHPNRFPIVLTVHDMIHEIYYPDDPEVEIKRKAILAAQSIICVSHNTKKDLLERYPQLENKVHVAYLASEIDANLSYGSEPVPTQPYFVYIGRRATHKNFDALLKAFAKVASVHPESILCVVGNPLEHREQAVIAELKLTNRIQHYSALNDQHLAKLYRCSVALVYPSHYEGFGIPPLEAMACGTAVIASNASSIPEVVGDAGLLCDPNAINDLADHLLFLLDNPSERDRLIQQGAQRAKTFTWDKTIQQTLDVYRSVAA